MRSSAEETTSDDLVLARALLAERSPEDIAAALARLYRARLPSPEDLLDPGQGRSREDRHAGKDSRISRGDGREAQPGAKKKLRRDVMAEGSVWFRAAIGRRKNAEARWLLPMICRRGGVEKQDIGAIRIMDTTTEFEISAKVADAFATAIKRPDKEDNIRIEFLGDAPAERPHTTKSWDGPKHRTRKKEAGRDARREDRPRDEPARQHHGKSHGEGRPAFDKTRGPKTKAGPASLARSMTGGDTLPHPRSAAPSRRTGRPSRRKRRRTGTVENGKARDQDFLSQARDTMRKLKSNR